MRNGPGKFSRWIGLFLLAAVLTGCSAGCPPRCLGERMGSVDWSGRNLRGAVLLSSAARQSNFNQVDFSEADLSGMDLNNSSLKAANLTDGALIGIDLQNAFLSGAVFTRANLTGANLAMADLTGVRLTSSTLTAAYFGESQLVNADLSQLNLAGATLDGANMTGANLDQVNLAGSLLRQVDLSGASLHFADLRGSWINLSTLVAADMREANLSGASLIGTNLTGANLSGASLSGANLIGAVLRGADLRGADLRSAELLATQTLVTRENMDDEILKGMSEAQWEKLALGDTILDGARYDTRTQWPEGFTPPGGTLYEPSTASAAVPETKGQHIEAEIEVVGSAAVSDIAVPLARAYMLEHPELMVQVIVEDSHAGISKMGEQKIDMGMSSRGLTQAEKDTYPDLEAIHVANDSIVPVVNLHNPITDLKVDQIRAIYSGDIRNWQELGGPDLEITFLQQDITLFDVFTELVMSDTPVLDDLSVHLPSNPAVRAWIASDAGAIGMLPKRFVDRSVKPLTVNGIQASSENVRSGQYPLIRSYYLVTSGDPDSQIQGWLDFIFSAAGSQSIQYEGLEPIDYE